MQATPLQNVVPYSPDYKQAAVLQYCVSGYALFACKSAGTEHEYKSPALTGWKETPFNPFVSAADLPVCFGVVLKDDDLVLDFDPRRGEDQLAQLFEALQLPRTETFIVKTGGGGLHLYFRKPAGVPMRARVPGFPAVEIKTAGKFVVAAGARHPNGQYYEVVRGNPRKREFAPKALLDLCTAPEADTAATVETDDTDTQRVFIHYLLSAPPAIEGQGGSTATYATAAQGKDYGLSEDTAFQLMLEHYNPRCIPEWPPADLRKHVANAYRYGQNTTGSKNALAQFSTYQPDTTPATEIDAATQAKIRWDTSIVSGQTKLDGTLRNAVNYFLIPHSAEYKNPLLGLIRYSQLNGRIEFTRPAPWHKTPKQYWDDTDTVMLKWHLQTGDDGKRGAFAAISKPLCDEAVTAVAQQNQYHPIKDWLNDIKWDGTPRLDWWLVTYCGAARTDLVREFGKNTFLAAVARQFQPGCKHDSMLVLEGPQDKFKSTAIAVLGGAWYADIKIAVETVGEEIRTVQAMQNGWILEASEMEFTRKSEVNAIKRFLTKTVDIVRLPYRQHESVLPRQSIFIGSVNPTEEGYLRDKTGNRRFWPVVVTQINVESLARDREQLFAEAVARYRQGEPWWIADPALRALANGEAMKRVETDLWDEIIANWLVMADDGKTILTTDYVAFAALHLQKGQIRRVEQSRIVGAMRAAGYKSQTIKGGKVRAWVKQNQLLERI